MFLKNVTFNLSFVDAASADPLSYLISYLGCFWNEIHHHCQHDKIFVQEGKPTGSLWITISNSGNHSVEKPHPE